MIFRQHGRGGLALTLSSSSGPIVSVSGQGGLQTLLRNTLGKQIEAMQRIADRAVRLRRAGGQRPASKSNASGRPFE